MVSVRVASSSMSSGRWMVSSCSSSMDLFTSAPFLYYLSQYSENFLVVSVYRYTWEYPRSYTNNLRPYVSPVNLGLSL